MRLYRMELYKLCHKKSFLAGFLFVLLIGLFFFCEDVQSQYCVINGVEYTGLKAIRANRQITEEFRGVLTDDKVSQIVEKYGFPTGKPDRYDRLSGNFLNTFVMTYVSDGYNNGWDDYRPATRALPLADSDLGRYHTAAGMEIRLEYYDGWESFLSQSGALMLGVSMLILYIVSIVFSEEEQVSMKPLMFTTKEGPSTDTLAKIAAALSISAGIWLVSVSFYLLLYSIVYGTDGLSCIASLVSVYRFRETPLLMQSIGKYLAVRLLVSLLAVLELCAVTICMSARCHSSFHAIVAAGICYVMPFLGFMLFELGIVGMTIYQMHHQMNSFLQMICLHLLYLVISLVQSSPLYLMCNRDILMEIVRTEGTEGMRCFYATLSVAVVLFILCTISAYRRYRKPQTR